MLQGPLPQIRPLLYDFTTFPWTKIYDDMSRRAHLRIDAGGDSDIYGVKNYGFCAGHSFAAYCASLPWQYYQSFTKNLLTSSKCTIPFCKTQSQHQFAIKITSASVLAVHTPIGEPPDADLRDEMMTPGSKILFQ